jgi:siroheme synthase
MSDIVSVTSVSLAFWETGPIRDIVETEFEMALIDALGKRGRRLDADEEKQLHDAVVPDALLEAMEREFIGAGKHPGEFLVRKQPELQRDIADKLRIALDRRDDAARPLSGEDPSVLGGF